MKRVLIIAGSDSGGGAGIQADIKTVTALGGYAATAVTSVTVQDTQRVHGVHSIPPKIIREQIEVVLGDIGADCIKIGMIGSVEAGEAIAAVLPPRSAIPVVLDPVLIATSGDQLGDSDVLQLLRDVLIPRATVLTPNLPELTALTGADVSSREAIEAAARALCDVGATAVLAKGGHAEAPVLVDQLVTATETLSFEHPRLETTNTHGTGCSLASAIATGLAQGLSIEQATSRGIEAVQLAIRSAPDIGSGHGPLNHGAMAALRRD